MWTLKTRAFKFPDKGCAVLTQKHPPAVACCSLCGPSPTLRYIMVLTTHSAGLPRVTCAVRGGWQAARQLLVATAAGAACVDRWRLAERLGCSVFDVKKDPAHWGVLNDRDFNYTLVCSLVPLCVTDVTAALEVRRAGRVCVCWSEVTAGAWGVQIDVMVVTAHGPNATLMRYCVHKVHDSITHERLGAVQHKLHAVLAETTAERSRLEAALDVAERRLAVKLEQEQAWCMAMLRKEQAELLAALEKAHIEQRSLARTLQALERA